MDQLAEEFAVRCRMGESPSIAGYTARDPDRAERIRGLLEAVAMMEQLRPGMSRSRESGWVPSVPERLGEFRIIRELGRGGMGVVYEANQESLGRRVALKVIHPIRLEARRLQRFRREAQAAAQLRHTNIVPVFGVDEYEGTHYYVMQFIEGSGLDALLRAWREGESPGRDDHWRFVAHVGVQAAEALHYAHEHGILHRDIKPANLLVDARQALWITDFGLAKLEGHADLTASGDVVGTLRYLAPESLRGQADRRSEVYSLGQTLWELLTLMPPFGDLHPGELLQRVSEGQPVRPRRLRPGIPVDLDTIVVKATAREPEHRYQTAEALADDLRRFLEDRPVNARRLTAIERGRRWACRNRAVAALSAAAAGSLLLAAVVGWLGYTSTGRALRRADDNGALSLAALEGLFDQLNAHDAQPPTPLRRTASETPPASRIEASRWVRPANDAALIQRVLAFYESFAGQNQMDPRLQGEAAWAYRKVAVLQRRLGHAREADVAYERAIGMFEGLIERNPRDPVHRFRLVETYDLADPWSAVPSALDGLGRRLHRARELIDQLVAESPSDVDYALARVHVYVKVGVTSERLGRTDDAESCYRRAIAIEGELIDGSARAHRARNDRAITQEALASLLLERGSRHEARICLNAAVADLLILVKDKQTPPRSRDRFEALANLFRALGEPNRAEALTDLARSSHGPAARRGDTAAPSWPGLRNHAAESGGPADHVGQPRQAPGIRPARGR
jgi:serine/threonine protein kinase